jgi:CheY-like chemotaxis protein
VRSTDLTYQLLTFARGGTPIKKFTSLSQLITETTIFTLHGANVEPIVELPQDLWPVEVDSGQLGQVIQNLVLNAMQAMPEGGHLFIRAENMEIAANSQLSLVEGKYLRISIRDEGIGISTENLQKIFDPYFTTKSQGNGLGLAVCYSIINRHDGLICVESEIGKGSTFYIYLPISASYLATTTNIYSATPISNANKAATSMGRVGQPKKILVMDDEPVLRRLLEKILQKQGYAVELAADGKQAVTLYQAALEKSKPFDMAILDLTIPGGLGGKQTIAQLLAIDPAAKAVVCSGYSEDAIMANYQEYGFAGVLVKPYLVQELNTLLKRVLEA